MVCTVKPLIKVASYSMFCGYIGSNSSAMLAPRTAVLVYEVDSPVVAVGAVNSELVSVG